MRPQESNTLLKQLQVKKQKQTSLTLRIAFLWKVALFAVQHDHLLTWLINRIIEDPIELPRGQAYSQRFVSGYNKRSQTVGRVNTMFALSFYLP